MYHVLEIKADGRIIKTVQKKAPEYDQWVKAVDGFVQCIPYFTKAMHEGKLYSRGHAYADEEGLLKRKPFNSNATKLWRYSCPDGDPDRMYLFGDVIFYAKVKDELPTYRPATYPL
jgi:hypothetical protein